MNRKYLLPAIATVLIFSMLLSSTQVAFAQTLAYTIGPKLVVVTIPEDDQKRETGVIILGLQPLGLDGTGGRSPWPKDKGFSDCTFQKGGNSQTQPVACQPLSQHKLLVTFNGQVITWRLNTNDPVPSVTCDVFEKDKLHPVPNKDGTTGPQFPEENLVTNPVKVNKEFTCKERWKSPVAGTFESAGVLDVYYTGPADAHFIADNILVVNVVLVVGRATIVGTDIQDICVLGWSMSTNHLEVTLPDGRGKYNTWADPLGKFVSCEEAALWQRDDQGIPIGQVEGTTPA
jgi:hypothetical protein